MTYDASIDGPDDLAAELEQLFDHREDLPPSRAHRDVPPDEHAPVPTAPAVPSVTITDLVEVVRQVVREEREGRDEPPAPPPFDLDLDALADALLSRLPPPEAAPVSAEPVVEAHDGDPGGQVIDELRRELDLLAGQLEGAFASVEQRLDQIQLAATVSRLQADGQIIAMRSVATALQEIESIARGHADANAADAISEARVAVESQLTTVVDAEGAAALPATVDRGFSGLRATPRTGST